MRSEAPQRAHADGRRDHRGAAAEVRADARASACSCRTRRRSASAACRRRSQYQYTLQDPDTEELYRVAPMFEAALHASTGFRTSRRDLQIANPQVSVDLDRDQIAALGLTVDQVESALNSRLRHASGVADLRAGRPVPGDHAGRAGVSARSRGAVDALRAGAERQAGSALDASSRRDRPSGRCRSTTPGSSRR